MLIEPPASSCRTSSHSHSTKVVHAEREGVGPPRYGNYGFAPLSLKSDRRAVTWIKNGRFGMIAFGGMMQHLSIGLL